MILRGLYFFLVNFSDTLLNKFRYLLKLLWISFIFNLYVVAVWFLNIDPKSGVA